MSAATTRRASGATRALLRSAVDERDPHKTIVALAYGQVTATSPFTVAFNGTEDAAAVEGVARLSSYTPAIGDIIIMTRVGPAWVALGAVV